MGAEEVLTGELIYEPIQNLTLELNKSTTVQNIKIVGRQGESANTISIHVLKNSQPVDIKGFTLNFKGVNSQGEMTSQAGYVIDAEEGIMGLQFTQHNFAREGEFKFAYIELIDTHGKMISSINFTITVLKAADIGEVQIAFYVSELDTIRQAMLDWYEEMQLNWANYYAGMKQLVQEGIENSEYVGLAVNRLTEIAEGAELAENKRKANEITRQQQANQFSDFAQTTIDEYHRWSEHFYHRAWAMGPSGEEKAWGDPRFDNNLIPVNNRKFAGWQAYQSAQVILTQSQTVEEWNTLNATRIQTAGGANIIKYLLTIDSPSINGQSYANSIWVKNIGVSNLVITMNGSVNETIQPGISKKVNIIRTGNGSTHHQFQFRAPKDTDNLDFIAWRPKVEYSSVATPFALTNPTHVSETIPTHSPDPPTNIPSWVYNWSAWVGGVTDSLPIYTHTAWAIGASGEKMNFEDPIKDNNLLPNTHRFLAIEGSVSMLSNNTTTYPISREVINEDGIEFMRVRNNGQGTNTTTISVYVSGISTNILKEGVIGKRIVFSVMYRTSNHIKGSDTFSALVSNGNRTLIETGNVEIGMGWYRAYAVIDMHASNVLTMTVPTLSLNNGVEYLDVMSPKIEFGEMPTRNTFGALNTHKGTWTTNNPNALPFPELYDWKPI
jgi:hypothetical protein